MKTYFIQIDNAMFTTTSIENAYELADSLVADRVVITETTRIYTAGGRAITTDRVICIRH